jgi:hypothetical protein
MRRPTVEKPKKNDKEKTDSDEVLETITRKTGSIYHVMNNTCINLRTKDPNIYMYRRERIYKKTWRNIIIEKG